MLPRGCTAGERVALGAAFRLLLAAEVERGMDRSAQDMLAVPDAKLTCQLERREGPYGFAVGIAPGPCGFRVDAWRRGTEWLARGYAWVGACD